MTRRSRAAALDPVYGRGRADCLHIVEPRVAYDRLAAGYRAGLRCGCGQVEVTSRRVHELWDAAEAEAKRMLLNDRR